MARQLPTKPERPLDSDCCGQGCVPCVMDIYEEDLKIWEEECRRIESGDQSDESYHRSLADSWDGKPVLSSDEYRSFVIDTVSQETHDTYRYRLTLPHGATLGLAPGQHVVIRGQVGEESVTRQYTPVSDVKTKSFFELLIKLYETGRMSHYVKTWTQGTSIQLRGPLGSLQYRPNQYRCVYMLAVGTGIAPMCQVIQAILNNEDDDTRINLMYGCRTYTDILLKNQIDVWSGYWNFTCTYYLSQEPVSMDRRRYRYGDTVIQGRICRDVVRTHIVNPRDNLLVLVCGTRQFDKEMLEILADIEVPTDRQHKF